MKYEIVIKRSRKRYKTVSAKFERDKIVISAPARISDKDLKPIVEELAVKVIRQRETRNLNKTVDLFKRAEYLNYRYFNGNLKINSIKFVSNQNSLHGSCSVHSGDIRISDKVASFPQWVIDYLIVHELAHLIEPNHSKRFKELEYRYEYAERAKGFLIAKDMENFELK